MNSLYDRGKEVDKHCVISVGYDCELAEVIENPQDATAEKLNVDATATLLALGESWTFVTAKTDVNVTLTDQVKSACHQDKVIHDS